MHHLHEDEAINLNYSYFSLSLRLPPSHLPCAALQKMKKEIAMTYQFGFKDISFIHSFHGDAFFEK
jgi:hypothetical protein